ncbi:MAG TPA: NAD(P)H-binding protein [Thermodesulfobacteriota bacterium]|nr:NAD(P)H-binding protein [Thermodesulfobacteriota bacterium]
MSTRTYAIMGATGQIGRRLTAELLGRGHAVRAIGRSREKLAALEAKGARGYSLAFDDAAALAAAFRGADAVFGLIPPDYGADDFGAAQDRAGEAIVAAVREAGVARVLNLSSLGAQHAEGTGPIKGLHRQERRLDALAQVSVLHLRPGYFMENFFWSIPTIKAQGIVASALRADLPVFMVATADIALKAAELLDRLDFAGHGVFEFAGPTEVTMADATAAIGRAIGRPDLRYVQLSYDDERQALLGAGMKPSIVDLLVEMHRGMNEGRVAPTGPLGPGHRGPTTIEAFASTFAEVYRGR